MIVRYLARALSTFAMLAGVASSPARADVTLSGPDANAGTSSTAALAALAGVAARSTSAA